MIPEQFPKVCACKREYTNRDWLGLPLVGYHEDEEERLELRNCPCGSTIAVVVPPVYRKGDRVLCHATMDPGVVVGWRDDDRHTGLPVYVVRLVSYRDGSLGRETLVAADRLTREVAR